MTVNLGELTGYVSPSSIAAWAYSIGVVNLPVQEQLLYTPRAAFVAGVGMQGLDVKNGS